jgi:hypothetical protein
MLGRIPRPNSEVVSMLRKSLWVVPLGLVLLGVATAAYASSAASGPRMGPPTRIVRKAFHGYYDGHKDT